MITKALVVDDDVTFANALQIAFERRGIKKVVTANEPETALQQFTELKPKLVTLDYRMPKRDGLSLLREMQAIHPESIFILLTGYGSIPLAVEAMRDGAQGFLTKPCDADEILAEAERVQRSKQSQVHGLSKSDMLSYNLTTIERAGIEKALEATKGNVSKAAILLGIDRRTLQRKMKTFASIVFIFGVGILFGLDSFAVKNSRQDETAKFMALTGDADFGSTRTAWDKTYARSGYVFGKNPVEFLKENIELLPKGRALDIAMGEGRNAVYMAKKGFMVEGVDISSVGIRKAQALAAENGVKINAIQADLTKFNIKPNHYSVIANFYYLQRNLIDQIKMGLKPGGIVIFETYTVDQLNNKSQEKWEKRFLLHKDELRKQFSDFEIIVYEEKNDGKKAIASLIARKPQSKKQQATQ